MRSILFGSHKKRRDELLWFMTGSNNNCLLKQVCNLFENNSIFFCTKTFHHRRAWLARLSVKFNVLCWYHFKNLSVWGDFLLTRNKLYQPTAFEATSLCKKVSYECRNKALKLCYLEHVVLWHDGIGSIYFLLVSSVLFQIFWGFRLDRKWPLPKKGCSCFWR